MEIAATGGDRAPTSSEQQVIFMNRFVPLTILGLAVLSVGGRARADHKVIMPRSDSAVDWGTRKRVEAAVLDLAQHVDRGASQTDSPYSELVKATGCSGGLAKCKDSVLDAIDVDELVLITIKPASDGQVTVTVKRASRRGVGTGTVVAPVDAPEAALRQGLGPLFGLSARESAAEAARPKQTPAKPTSGGGRSAVSPEKARAMAALQARTTPGDASAEAEGAAEPVTEAPPTEAPSTDSPQPEAIIPVPGSRGDAEDPAASTVTAAPDNVVVVDRPAGRFRRAYVGGVIAGGALALVGVVLWVQASGVNDDLRGAPNRTSADVQRILDLEARGDRYALWGNITFVGGIVVAGASGYLLWRDHRRHGRGQARLAPTVFAHGAGVTLTFGADR